MCRLGLNAYKMPNIGGRLNSHASSTATSNTSTMDITPTRLVWLKSSLYYVLTSMVHNWVCMDVAAFVVWLLLTNDVCLAEFLESHIFLQLPGSMYPNMNLLWQGCLSAAPTRVSFAVTLHTLELYRRLHVHQPRLSIQAFVWSICNYHNVSIFCPCLPTFFV
jgi:hypothetical protein